MPEKQLDLFSTSTTEQESNPVHKASAMLLERRLKPPAVIMQNQGPEIVVPRTRENNLRRQLKNQLSNYLLKKIK
jgi:hypothetical protein